MSAFFKYYPVARAYYEENGNLLIPEDYVVNDINVGMWIKNLRTFAYKINLKDEQIALLNSIGMVWNLEEYNWDETYKFALEYFLENGHLLANDKEKYKDFYLGRWLIKQRTALKRGKLSLRRIKKLEYISIPWDLKRGKSIQRILSSIENCGETLDCFVEKFDIDVLSSLVNIVSCRIVSSEELANIIDNLKSVVNKYSYQMFVLFFAGVSIEKIASIFNISVEKEEEIRMQVYDDFIDLLRFKEIVKHKKKVKKIGDFEI